jgi:hypothetical protein
LSNELCKVSKAKPEKQIACECETNKKQKLGHSKPFLGLATLFATFMLAYPDYAHIFYSKADKQIGIIKKSILKLMSSR